MELTKTRGFLDFRNFSLRLRKREHFLENLDSYCYMCFYLIMSRNEGIRPGFGYNSISDGNTKCELADIRAMFLPTLTG